MVAAHSYCNTMIRYIFFPLSLLQGKLITCTELECMKMDEVNYPLDTTVSSCPSSLRHVHNVMYVPHWRFGCFRQLATSLIMVCNDKYTTNQVSSLGLLRPWNGDSFKNSKVK